MTEMHPAVQEKLDWFDTEHVADDLRWVVGYCRDLAGVMSSVPSHPQLTIGLQHLLEAKDCFVRAVIAARKADTELLAEPVTADYRGHVKWLRGERPTTE